MHVNEIFSSIQGEGIASGLPFTFIRFQKCNLRCFYCDTPKALFTQSKNRKDYSVETLIKQVKKIGNKRVCLTGGEPLLQNTKDFYLLLKELKKNYFFTNIQTNGTIFKNSYIPFVDLWSISIKIQLLDNKKYLTSLDNYFLHLRENYELKIILTKEEKKPLLPLLKIIQKFPVIIKKQIPIIITPDGRKTKSILSELKKLYYLYLNSRNEKIKKLHLRFLPQLHKLIGIT